MPSVPGDLLVLNREMAIVMSLREICARGRLIGSKSVAGKEFVGGSGTDQTCSDKVVRASAR